MALLKSEGVSHAVHLVTSPFRKAGVNGELQTQISTSQPQPQRGDRVGPIIPDLSIEPSRPRRKRRIRGIAIPTAVVLLTAACGASSSTGGHPETQSTKIGALVPATLMVPPSRGPDIFGSCPSPTPSNQLWQRFQSGDTVSSIIRPSKGSGKLENKAVMTTYASPEDQTFEGRGNSYRGTVEIGGHEYTIFASYLPFAGLSQRNLPDALRSDLSGKGGSFNLTVDPVIAYRVGQNPVAGLRVLGKTSC